ncbi:hypothetical protein [Flavobacterium sp.]|uniref:hypothetical protein n=1 Tax=Flavobacterium sp. TaxID=239 RepID=UPI0026266FAA|nr:hypothetical protein [Flavobacterium sp.]
MSERWKFQVRMGLFWGIFMSVFQLLFELNETPALLQLNNKWFYIRLLLQILAGIFVVGYFSWTSREKKA